MIWDTLRLSIIVVHATAAIAAGDCLGWLLQNGISSKDLDAILLFPWFTADSDRIT
jgi:ABC-type proline/glycine betaine transport system permease subunit